MANVVRIHEHGGPLVLRVETANIGAPGPDEVILRQEFVGVNFVDTLVRSGAYPQPAPTIPGFEAAGVLIAVGADVTDFAVGDRVGYFFVAGAYAAERTVAAHSLVHLPDDVSTETAATFLAKGLTAWMGLYALHDLKAGEPCLCLLLLRATLSADRECRCRRSFSCHAGALREPIRSFSDKH